jgi:hypothetical protein
MLPKLLTPISCLVVFCWLASTSLAESPADAPAEPLPWMTNYSEAMQTARAAGKMLLIYFNEDGASDKPSEFESSVLSDESIRQLLKPLVLAKIPTTATGQVNGEQIKLLDHAAYAELLHCPGVAMIDLRDADSIHHGCVVSIFPFRARRTLSREQTAVLLNLPAGSLTQRTLIFAVRTHPEKPASADKEFYPVLAEESESHAKHQANINLQGHHNWNTRFHRINGRLPGSMLSQEVCAESWPGQGLVDAAIECVHSWRQSSGHWNAVSGQQPLFGYDMKRGSNGTWYATGIFARGR